MIERHPPAAVSAELARSLDYETSLREVCALPVRTLADWCVLYVRGDDEGGGDRHELATSIEGAGELAQQLRGLPIDPRRSVMREALLTGRSLLVERLGEPADKALVDCAERTDLFAAIAPLSLMVVALKGRDRIIGALLLLSSQPGRHYGSADLLLAEEMAQMAALALDNARLYQQAQSAISARNEVLAVVAHDLRSPLNGVLLTLDFLAEKLTAQGQLELVDPWVTGLLSSARAMDRLVGELLELTRLESGQVKLQRHPLDAAYVIERALTEARSRHPDAAMTMTARVAPGLPAVEGDEARVCQVLGCLISNLVKFRSDEAKEITVAAAALGGGVRWSVSDVLSPTPPDELPNLFTRFWTAGHLDRRGAALSLSIARALVSLHGGRIWAESSPEEGTTFLFTLAA
jgi:signal transduction histidine kinase